MKVALLIADGGDGSACIRYFKNVNLAMTLLDDDNYCETFGLNEGDCDVIEVPADFIPPGGYWADEDYGDEEC